MSNKKNIFLNVLANVIWQITTVICGFITPKVILSVFGSEVNGLVASLTQFLGYITLVEGGIGGIIMARLYKPLLEKDYKKISSIVNTSRVIFKKVAIILMVYTAVIAFVCPLFLHNFSFAYIAILAIILSFTLFIQFGFSLTYQILLRADKKVYLVSFTQTAILILNTILFVTISKICPNIHVLKLITALLYLLQPIVFGHYVKKHYPINTKEDVDEGLLRDRWTGFSISLSGFIHDSTDITLLTLFTNLKTVSVYAVYTLVSKGLRNLIQAFSNAVAPNIGHLVAKGDTDELNKKFDILEYVTFALSAMLFTIGALLITPFVLVYTKNISDANYNQLTFGLIIMAAEFIYCIRDPYANIAYSANRFKDVRKHAYIEAVINIFTSIVLVNLIGLIGVAIGTLIAMTYRTLYHVLYLKNNILHRTPKKILKKLIVFGTASTLSMVLCIYFFPMQDGVMSFLMNTLIYTAITAFFYLLASIIFYRNELHRLKTK